MQKSILDKSGRANALSHTQNTDSKLDNGGVNEVDASDLRTHLDSVVNHNDLGGLNAGDDYEHLTAAQKTIITRAATSSQNGYATSTQISKLDGIEVSADVTDAANIALSIYSVDGLETPDDNDRVPIFSIEPASWDMLDEDCSDISDWVDDDTVGGVSDVDPAGQFRFHSGLVMIAQAARYRTIDVVSELTLEFSLYHDTLTLGLSESFQVSYNDGNHTFEAAFYVDGLYVHGANWSEVGTNLVKQSSNAEWQTWRFVVTMGETCDVYLDDSTHDWELVGSGIDCAVNSSVDSGIIRVKQLSFFYSSNITHMDYIKVATGLYPGLKTVLSSVFTKAGDSAIAWFLS